MLEVAGNRAKRSWGRRRSRRGVTENKKRSRCKRRFWMVEWKVNRKDNFFNLLLRAQPNRKSLAERLDAEKARVLLS